MTLNASAPDIEGLPFDLVESVLCCLPNFATLHAAIVAAKVFNDVFNIHPTSIMRSIAQNMVGNDSLPSILRLVSWQVCKKSHLTTQNISKFRDLLLVESIPPHRPISWAEGKHITYYSEYAWEFECLFSRRYKDCQSQNSLLDNEESVRFQTALARVWLYYEMFHETSDSDVIEDNFSDGDELDAEQLEDDDDEDDEDPTTAGMGTEDVGDDEPGSDSDTEDEDEEQHVDHAGAGDHEAPLPNPVFSNTTNHQVQTNLGIRSSLLPQLTAQELLDFDHVHTFLACLLVDAAKRNVKPSQNDLTVANRYGTRLFSAGPGWLLDRFRPCHSLTWQTRAWIGDLDEVPRTQLLELLEKANVTNIPEWDLYTQAQGIVGSAVGTMDQCDHCHAITGLDLRSLDCLNDISCKFNVWEIKEKLPGRLPHSPFEADLLKQYLQANSEFTTEQLIAEIFDMRLPQVDHWKQPDRLCLTCFDAIIRACLRDWWLAAKATLTGYVQQPDCWWGDECNTQVHKIEHAMKLNHLCPKTGRPPRQSD